MQVHKVFDRATIAGKPDITQNQRVPRNDFRSVVDVRPAEREVEVVGRGTDHSAVYR